MPDNTQLSPFLPRSSLFLSFPQAPLPISPSELSPGLSGAPKTERAHTQTHTQTHTNTHTNTQTQHQTVFAYSGTWLKVTEEEAVKPKKKKKEKVGCDAHQQTQTHMHAASKSGDQRTEWQANTARLTGPIWHKSCKQAHFNKQLDT